MKRRVQMRNAPIRQQDQNYRQGQDSLEQDRNGLPHKAFNQNLER